MRHLSVGLGPWLALAGGLVAFVGMLLVLPWGGHQIVVHADGSVDRSPYGPSRI